ncbi:hypothetical protein L6R52_02860 [Myxococcota bacterium]|nr:hypothetical protein [Myxococcota bacterium]
MKTPLSLLALLTAELFALGLVTSTAQASDKGPWGFRDDEARERSARFAEVIARVTAMPSDYELQQRVERRGLQVLDVMWEDTGRDLGSSVGPNISDLTLQVREEVDGGIRTHLLPVIRHPNFTDKTADVRADKIWVRVGNHTKGGEKVAVPLTEVLANLKEYLSDPESLKGTGNFLAKRDTHFLVSAQHVFLPIPKRGKVEFNPVLFNYQSSPGNPAVLTLLITREGTSATVIENRAGDQSYQGWGQQLFFNSAGQKTAFTAERKSDVKARIEAGQAQASDEGALEEGADMMMIVQVPLVYSAPRRYYGEADDLGGIPMAPMAASGAGAAESKAMRRGGVSDVEQAVLGHGEELGAFTEMSGLALRRDERFPIRVTVQFYKATTNGVVSEADLTEVARTIKKVYSSGDYVGSLVVPESEHVRPTSWTRDRARVRWTPTFHHDRYGRLFR